MPSVEPWKFAVYPTGWHESPLGQKEIYVIYVERRDFVEDSWRITDGYSELSSAGNWNYPDKKIRRFHRFTLDDALARAQAAVDVRIGPRGTFAAADHWWRTVRAAATSPAS